jgi:hypothetical protein
MPPLTCPCRAMMQHCTHHQTEIESSTSNPCRPLRTREVKCWQTSSNAQIAKDSHHQCPLIGPMSRYGDKAVIIRR